VSRITRFYQFEIRGFHNLTHLSEPSHGHNGFLRIGLPAPLSEEDEKEFLLFVKSRVLSDFDKKDWSLSLDGEPSGENLIREIALRLQAWKPKLVRQVEFQETTKNNFLIQFQ